MSDCIRCDNCGTVEPATVDELANWLYVRGSSPATPAEPRPTTAQRVQPDTETPLGDTGWTAWHGSDEEDYITIHDDGTVEQAAERVHRHLNDHGFEGASVAARLADRMIDVDVPNIWGDPLLGLYLFVDHLRKALR